MADLSAVSTVELLLTRAADAAGKAASLPGWASDWAHISGLLTTEGWAPELQPMIAASGPDHWRAVEATFRAMLKLHQAVVDGSRCYRCLWVEPKHPYPCSTLEALRPLAEQVLQHLGDTE